MEILIFIILLMLLLFGLVGVLFPVLPGIPFMFVIILIYAFADKFHRFRGSEIAIFAILAVVSILVDYLSGLFGARLFGASAKGTIGGLIGSLTGLFLFPPFGIFIGLAAGVLVAELLFAKKTVVKSAKASAGSLLGALAGIMINIIVALCFITLFIFYYWK